MDLSFISATTAAISAARDIGKAAIGIRDFNQMASTVAQMNDQILKAQDCLFAHNGQLFGLQQEVFDLKEALRKSEAALAQAKDDIAKLNQKKLELDQYERFRLPGGAWAYRRKDASPNDPDAPQYCAGCFGSEKLALLQPGTGADRGYLVCAQCGAKARRR